MTCYPKTHTQLAPPEFPRGRYATAKWCEREAQKMGFSFAVSGFAEEEHKYNSRYRVIHRQSRLRFIRDGHGGRVLLRPGLRVTWWGESRKYSGTVRTVGDAQADVDVDFLKVGMKVEIRKLVVKYGQ